ncbi:MAG: hypothetical protein IJ191_09050 [Treponema sp.]|nr:hypothetical protein [Treponema sp.]
MKALIISDDDTVIDATVKTLAGLGYDSIVYRWLLKALDNVEEIAPALIVISECDYPRHWKTFVAHVKSTTDTPPTVILFTQEQLSEEERKKAAALGIQGFYSGTDAAQLEELMRAVRAEQSPAVRPAAAEKTIFAVARATLPELISGVIFTHPHTGAFITGTATAVDGTTVTVTPDLPAAVEDIAVGDAIAEVSYSAGRTVQYCRATVRANDAGTVALQILEPD